MEIDIFLEANGFKIINQKTSEFFGDYFIIYSNNILNIKYRSSKSVGMVDIGSTLEKDNYYDLSLVKALLFNDNNLTKVTSMEDLADFLKTDFIRIVELFSYETYQSTKIRLNNLKEERVKQMFPNIK